MSNAYVIEIDDVAVGVVVRQGEADGGRRYCFYAANAPFRSIEGKAFRTPDKARKAAIALMGKNRKSLRAETVVRH
jgi:hypothetical protein